MFLKPKLDVHGRTQTQRSPIVDRCNSTLYQSCSPSVETHVLVHFYDFCLSSTYDSVFDYELHLMSSYVMLELVQPEMNFARKPFLLL